MSLGAAYVLQLIAEVWLQWPATALLALNPQTPIPGILLQVVAHPFVNPTGPGSVLMVALHLLFLWWTLSPFEMRFGPRRAALLCLLATGASAAAAILVGILTGTQGLLAGAGPWMLASIAGFAFSLPRNQKLLFFGVIPLQPMHIIGVLIGFSVLGFIASKDLIGLVSDLAATFAGVGYVRWNLRPPAARKPQKPKGGLRVIRGGSDEDDRPKYLN